MGQPLASPLFGKDNLPVDFDEALGGHAWATFRKKEPTKALRIDGTFRAITIHGGDPQVCHDGWLALDSQGHPYPIDRKVFEETFELMSDQPARDPQSEGPPPDGWQGTKPAEGTRRHLILETLRRVAPALDDELLATADAIEEALQKAGDPS